MTIDSRSLRNLFRMFCFLSGDELRLERLKSEMSGEGGDEEGDEEEEVGGGEWAFGKYDKFDRFDGFDKFEKCYLLSSSVLLRSEAYFSEQ